MEARPVGIGVLGYGDWGQRLSRCFAETEGAALVTICDPSETARAAAKRRYPSVTVTASPDDVLKNPAIDAVYLATPVGTHERLVLDALSADKDVLVEKPLAASVAGATRCVELAAERKRILMVGHTFVYSPPVRLIRDIVARGDLGRMYYVNSSRVNLGRFQKDVSVIWDLAPHDVSIVLFATGRRPVAVQAHGKSYFGMPTLEDVAMMTIELDDGSFAYVHVSWVSPVKMRRTTFVGDKSMIVYDDGDPVEKVKIFDKRVERIQADSFGEFQMAYRHGEVRSPVVDGKEPLSLEAAAFVRAIRTRETPESDGQLGLEVVRSLEAASRSMLEGGRMIAI